MRQFLLFALSMCVAMIGYAQTTAVKNGESKQIMSKEIKTYDPEAISIPNLPVNPAPSPKVLDVVTKYAVGSSANIYTMLVEHQTALDANAETGLISFTHRANPAVIGSASGDIIVTVSKDRGLTWTSNLVVEQDADHRNRYPSGAIYNPAGNTNPDNAYVVTCGPSHSGVDWDATFFGTIKADGTDKNTIFIDSDGELVRFNLVEAGGNFHVMGVTTTENPYTVDSIFMYNGIWNSTTNTVDWTKTAWHHDFVTDPASGDYEVYSSFNHAWSNDGMTGYYWSMGRDLQTDLRSMQPIVWKTTDGGTTWTKMPIFDFGTIQEIQDYTRPIKTDATKYKPGFSGYNDGVVDANGELHLFCYVKASSSDHIDSLSYQWNYALTNVGFANPIFDVYTTSTGWDAKFVGPQYCEYIEDEQSIYGSGTDALGWDLRLQAGKTADETKVFCSWTDTDTSIAPTHPDYGTRMNMYPDLKAFGWDVNSGNTVLDQNYTFGTAYEGDNYFHFMSDLIIEQGSDYIVPLTTCDIWTTSDPLSAVYHYYLFQSTVGINDIEANVEVSQNRPNPFNNFTQVDIRLTNTADVSIEVINAIGQKVYTQNYGKLQGGMHTLDIDASSLEAGVYFYTVFTGTSSVTNKMIVE